MTFEKLHWRRSKSHLYPQLNLEEVAPTFFNILPEATANCSLAIASLRVRYVNPWRAEFLSQKI